jgi:hypothetical protein
VRGDAQNARDAAALKKALDRLAEQLQADVDR